MAKITYADKEQAQAVGIPVKYQFTHADANEIKRSVNYLYEKFDWALDFLDQQVLDTFSPFDNWSIDSVVNINGSPVVNIEVNGSPYVLGDLIYVGQSFKVTVSIPSVVSLKCTQI